MPNHPKGLGPEYTLVSPTTPMATEDFQHKLTELAEGLARLEAIAEEQTRRTPPPIAIWTLVLTLILSALSVVYSLGQAKQEVASMRSTIEKWEPKIEQINLVGQLQQQVATLQQQVAELNADAPRRRRE